MLVQDRSVWNKGGKKSVVFQKYSSAERRRVQSSGSSLRIAAAGNKSCEDWLRESQNGRSAEWVGLARTLKPIWFQAPAIGRDTSTTPGCPRPLALGPARGRKIQSSSDCECSPCSGPAMAHQVNDLTNMVSCLPAACLLCPSEGILVIHIVTVLRSG